MELHMRYGPWQLMLLCILFVGPRLGLAQTIGFSPSTPKSGDPISVTFTEPFDCAALTPVLTASSSSSFTFASTKTDGIVNCPQIPVPPPTTSEFVVKLGILAAGTYDVTWNTYLRHVSDGTTVLVSSTTGSLVVAPGSVVISPGFTGNWFDPDSSGHGFSIEVLPGNTMLAEWYVFAPDGGQAWIAALGPITGNSAVLQGYFPAGPGGRFPPHFDPAQLSNQYWGTVTFVFGDCNAGQVSWQPAIDGYSSGWMPITRLTMPAGLTCP
jgi:hypothetical protein